MVPDSLTDEDIRGAALRWYERRIQRFYDEERSARDNLDDDVELGLSFRTSPAEKTGKGMTIQIQIKLEGELPDASFRYDCGVQFLTTRTEISDPAIREFAHARGGEYVLGYIRGALADGSRSVGLDAIVLPFFKLPDPESEDSSS